jgi:hypothetical protein
MGRGQVVRHQFLVLASGGSNPSAPAKHKHNELILLSYNIIMKSDDLLKRVEKLESRNRRVEGDKAWETSWFRRISIMIMTYIVVVFYLRFVVHIDPWVNALVPVIGFTFSTLTLSLLKQRWLDRRNRR